MHHQEERLLKGIENFARPVSDWRPLLSQAVVQIIRQLFWHSKIIWRDRDIITPKDYLYWRGLSKFAPICQPENDPDS